MSQAWNPSHDAGIPLAADAAVSERMDFIRRTYGHLAGAVVAFCGFEAVLLSLPFGQRLALWMLSGSWLFVLLAFMGVSWLANRWAQSSTSQGLQYLGLGVYTLAEAVIFAPLLLIARAYGGEGVIPAAALTTGLVFGGLTVFVFVTKADFSFLAPVLTIAGLAALGVIVLSMIMGFSLGLLFTGAMVAFACGWILHDTSNVLHRYRTDQHVAASLALFASVALLFWYILQLFLRLSDRR